MALIEQNYNFFRSLDDFRSWQKLKQAGLSTIVASYSPAIELEYQKEEEEEVNQLIILPKTERERENCCWLILSTFDTAHSLKIKANINMLDIKISFRRQLNSFNIVLSSSYKTSHFFDC